MAPEFVEIEHDLECDQQDDRELQPQRSLVLHEIEQDIGRIAHHLQLARDRPRPVAKLEFRFETGVETISSG